MRKLSYGMNVILGGYITAHLAGQPSRSDDIGWGVPSDELFQWWLDRERANSLSLYGRKLWVTMSSYCNDELLLADGRHATLRDLGPDRVPAQLARHTKVAFSSTTLKADWNTRLVAGDAVAEITRLKAEDGGPMAIGGATLAGTAMRAGLIDEYLLVTHPALVGGGIPFCAALDSWVNVDLVERAEFQGGVLLT